MDKNIIIFWVKIVNKLLLTISKTWEYLIKKANKDLTKKTNCLKLRLITDLLTIKNTFKFTVILKQFNLLNKTFTHYPQSLLIRLLI